MDNNETFEMTYSAQQQEEVAAIRRKYAAPEPDKMARLRALDAGVTRRATGVSITVGVIGTLLLGAGMSLMMSELGAAAGALAMPLGLALGVVGLAVLGCAYPLYRRVVRRERAKVAPEILRLTDELMQ